MMNYADISLVLTCDVTWLTDRIPENPNYLRGWTVTLTNPSPYLPSVDTTILKVYVPATNCKDKFFTLNISLPGHIIMFTQHEEIISDCYY